LKAHAETLEPLFAGFCFWTLLGLSFASQFYISSAKAGLDVSWKPAVNYALGDWYVFALLSVPVIHLARRFRFEGAAPGRQLPFMSSPASRFRLLHGLARLGRQWQSHATFQEVFKPLFG